MTLKEWFLSNNFRDIKDTNMTWSEVGALFNLTGNAARNQWRRSKARAAIKTPDTVKTKDFPKILIFDLETAPLRAFVWKIWKENINPINGQLLSESFMLTYSAKWLFEEEIMSGKLTPEEVKEEDDSRLLREMWFLLDEADLVLAHNAIGFDIPVINGRFLKKGLLPPMPYKVIDTLKVCQKQFRLPSNKLDYIGSYLGLGNKIKTDFSLWADCYKGDEIALENMRIYNLQDVKLLEEIYLTIRPYIQPHPNLGLFILEDVECCPTCTSKNLLWEGSYTTYTNSYDAFRCKDCGSIGRSKIPKYKRKNLTKPIPIV